MEVDITTNVRIPFGQSNATKHFDDTNSHPDGPYLRITRKPHCMQPDSNMEPNEAQLLHCILETSMQLKWFNSAESQMHTTAA